MKKEEIFKPRARLLLQLGDQLIRNESIALLELVKNSYDADARNVSVTMEKVDEKEKGCITIEDDGVGMDIDVITEVWMEPGSDYKWKMYLKDGERTKKYKRLPLGEKGIGRFGVHKLGYEIELISKIDNKKEVFLKIDWKRFETSRYLKDVPIDIMERNVPETFPNGKTGTKIVIKNLRNNWEQGMVREVYRAINSLCSPFDTPESFRVNFKIDKEEWIEELLSWEEIKEYTLFRFNCELEGDEIKKFKYEFTPWPTMDKLKPRIILESHPDVYKRKRMVYKDNSSIDLSVLNDKSDSRGKVKFEAFIFDRDPRVLELGLQDKRGLKKYLNSNGGIRVYRDGIRVYDYGEPGNDWLNLGGRRVNLPAKRISNNLILGAVHLNRAESSKLIEKTNREGFIEDSAYNTLRSAILYTVGIVESFRDTDKDKIRTFYGPTPSSEPVISSISNLRSVVEKKIKDEALKEEIARYLIQIENDYRTINETLLKSAGAGLSLSVVIHEIEKIVGELKIVVDREKPSRRLLLLIQHLSQIVESYGAMLRKSDYKRQALTKIIDSALFNIEFRLESHKVKVIKDYQNWMDDSPVKCNRNFVIGSIINIIDNSLWWLAYNRTEIKKIYIAISDEIPGHLSIVIADNGPGFTLPTDEITKPFVTGKPDGMGLGLHIVKELMLIQGGGVLFPEKDDFNILKEFRNGAVIALAFKKEGSA